MSWEWKEEFLDRLLVPIGLLIMFAYHAWLFYRYRNFPLTTVLGCDDYYKKIWAQKTLQLDAKDRGTSVSVISNNISAASTLSSVSLVLSSLIGPWIGSFKDKNIFVTTIIYGDKNPTIVSIKNFYHVDFRANTNVSLGHKFGSNFAYFRPQPDFAIPVSTTIEPYPFSQDW
ncbi:hypothetical protein POM88_017464 [Heracleum sosnowskyi]|uniref:Uncharacterized protein n=1 Tax=Heracleum sosnowskyi TaxID=360622 RepID=A0AAD8IPI3_9APIA|nr:hypothetical protein POM88_017464 [Heracleum sosnowskyi]